MNTPHIGTGPRPERLPTPTESACYVQTLPSGDTACIRESHTGRPCRYLPPFDPQDTQ